MTKKRLLVQGTRPGIEKAEKALLRFGFGTKANFAKVKYLSRTTVTNFFKLKPIQFDKFKNICEELGLNWEEIIDLSEEGDPELDEPKYNIRQISSSGNLDNCDEDLLVQQPNTSDIWISKKVALYISLESIGAIRATLHIQNQKAISGLMPFTQDELTKILTDFPKLAFRYSEEFIMQHDISAGNKLYNLTLSQPVRQALDQLEPSVIELVVVPNLQRLPWELMHNGKYFLGLRHDMCRSITFAHDSRGVEAATETSKSKVGKLKNIIEKLSFPSVNKINFLMISGEEIDVEMRLVGQYVANHKDVNFSSLSEATKHEVLDQLYLGQNVVHFISHAATDGVLMNDGVLDINMINEAVSDSTKLVVLSACETGMGLSNSTGYQLATKDINVLCSLTWVTTNLSQIITSSFYESILSGKTFGESLRLAKSKAYPMLGWWGFVLYGNPLETVTEIESVRNSHSVKRRLDKNSS